MDGKTQNPYWERAANNPKRFADLKSEFDTLCREYEQLLGKYTTAQEHIESLQVFEHLQNRIPEFVHEMNTPLGIGITASTLLFERNKCLAVKLKKSQLKKSELLTFIEENDENLGCILENLKKSCIMLQQMRTAVNTPYENAFKKDTFNLESLILHIIHTLSPRLREYNTAVKVFTDGNMNVSSCSEAINHVITNLVMNSLIHGFENASGGKISIGIIRKQSNIHIKYSDDGVGMSEEVLHSLYEPYFTTKKGCGGTGLGMKIIKDLIEDTLGGSIECSSQKMRGCEFHITIMDEGSDRNDN